MFFPLRLDYVNKKRRSCRRICLDLLVHFAFSNFGTFKDEVFFNIFELCYFSILLTNQSVSFWRVLPGFVLSVKRVFVICLLNCNCEKHIYKFQSCITSH